MELHLQSLPVFKKNEVFNPVNIKCISISCAVAGLLRTIQTEGKKNFETYSIQIVNIGGFVQIRKKPHSSFPCLGLASRNPLPPIYYYYVYTGKDTPWGIQLLNKDVCFFMRNS